MNTTATYTTDACSESTCAHVQRTAKRNTKVPGRTGAIARLAVVWIMTLISFVGSFFTLPDFYRLVGLGHAILEAFAGFGVLTLTAAMLWLGMKFIGFIAPKSFRLAKKFWQAWVPLTFFGVYIKFCIFCLLALVPITATFGLFSAVIMLIAGMLAGNIHTLSALALLVAGAAGVAGCSFWDLCKLRQVKPMAVIRQWFDRKAKK